jgi:D-xylose transport system substrate-binding protein
VIDTSGFKIGKEYDTPDWSPDQAQTEMEQAITALGSNGFVGVYAANDGTAGGAIAAMRGQASTPPPARSPARTPSWRRCSASSPASST